MSVIPQQNVYPGGIRDTYRTELQLKTPVYLLGVGYSLLTQHFGCQERIVLERSSYLWNPTPAQSQVYINYRDNMDYEVVGKRPSIIVDLGDVQYPRDVIGDVLQYNGEQGTFDILDRCESSWIFTCLSDKALDSLALATEIKYFWQTYRKYVAQTYGFDTLRCQQISRWQKQSEYKDYQGCAVGVQFSCQDNFSVGVESLKVAGIALDFTD